AGYAVDLARDGEEGLDLCSTLPYDAAVVDLMLPKLDGLSMIETIRRQGKTTPVLILSAKRSVDDRIRGLQHGGDDYLVKPFSFGELLARIQALIRRDSGNAESTILSAGTLHMDLLQRSVERDGQPIPLSAREFSLFEHLLRNKGRIVSKTSILEKIYDFSFDPQTNVVDVLVCRLRNKIDKGHEHKLIHTVRGMGYVLKED
ncbi:MAG TPA: response regulator transcription factor, partial [Desulfobulbus sp.]|nr:response regulator transcription factor [Desulfobulbus sp.]